MLTLSLTLTLTLATCRVKVSIANTWYAQRRAARPSSAYAAVSPRAVSSQHHAVSHSAALGLGLARLRVRVRVRVS